MTIKRPDVSIPISPEPVLELRLRAIRGKAENLQEEGYHTPMHAPTVAARDIRFLLSVIDSLEPLVKEFNEVKQSLTRHEPASMESVHKVVERICEDRKALAIVCENEVGVLRSLLDRPGGSDWARALTLLMPDLRGTMGRLLRVLVVTSTKRKE